VIGKTSALTGFDRLNDTIAAAQEDALAILLLHQRQTATVPSQSQVFLDELVPRQSDVGRQLPDFAIGQTHLSRPPTTGRATLAFVGVGVICKPSSTAD
jgi:hypothetical protein